MSEAVVLEHAAACGTDFLVYTGNFCGYCRALKNLLNRNDLTFTEYNFDEHDGLRRAVVQATDIAPSPWCLTSVASSRCLSVGLMKPTATQENVVSHSFNACDARWESCALGMFNQFHSPARRLEQVSDGPSVLNGNPHVLFTVHPKKALGFKFAQPQTQFHGRTRRVACTPPLDAIGNGELKQFLCHGAALRKSTDDQRPHRRFFRNQFSS